MPKFLCQWVGDDGVPFGPIEQVTALYAGDAAVEVVKARAALMAGDTRADSDALIAVAAANRMHDKPLEISVAIRWERRVMAWVKDAGPCMNYRDANLLERISALEAKVASMERDRDDEDAGNMVSSA